MPKTKKAKKSVRGPQPEGEIQLRLWLPDGSSLSGSYALYRTRGIPVVTMGPIFEPTRHPRKPKPLTEEEAAAGLGAIFG